MRPGGFERLCALGASGAAGMARFGDTDGTTGLFTEDFCATGFCAEGFCAEGFCAEGFCAEGFCADGFCAEGFCGEGIRGGVAPEVEPGVRSNPSGLFIGARLPSRPAAAQGSRGAEG
ncbi:hypothetical protein BH09ACT2_BH09ACT2_07880 [soil metagenome]